MVMGEPVTLIIAYSAFGSSLHWSGSPNWFTDLPEFRIIDNRTSFPPGVSECLMPSMQASELLKELSSRFPASENESIVVISKNRLRCGILLKF